MSTAPTLVALLRLNLDSDHPAAERIICELTPIDARMALRECSILLANAIRILCDNDRHEIDDYLSAMGATVAAFIEGCQ